jgi:hypothetical protein
LSRGLMVRDARSRAPHHEGLIPMVTISDSSCPHLLALVAGIHVFRAVPHQKAWMAGTSPRPRPCGRPGSSPRRASR